MRQICNRRGLRWTPFVINTDTPPEELQKEIRQMIDGPWVRYVLIDPLLDIPLDEVIGAFPGIGFVVFKDTATDSAPNLLRIEYDRTAAYREAGQICGRLLQTGAEFLSAIQSPGERLKLGRLLPQREEADTTTLFSAFRETFGREYDAADLLDRKIRNLYDRNEISKKIDELVQRGVVVIFPSLTLSDAYCLETGTKQNLYMVMENWRFSGSPLDSRVLLSIHEPFTNAVEGMLTLQAGKKKDRNQFEWALPMLQVQAEVIKNKILESPPID